MSAKRTILALAGLTVLALPWATAEAGGDRRGNRRAVLPPVPPALLLRAWG